MSHQNGQPETPGATRRLTVAQALIEFLVQQRAEHDGERHPFFAGCFGIFGHGNLAGIGQALQQQPRLRYYQGRNEQAMVHAAVAYAKHKDRLQAFACTASVGPGATNMITGAATATINRIPVLLLPGDVFATRRVNPVLQQLESPHSGDISVNDAFRPVSRYWDRINRPEQLVSAALEAMRVLTDPAETGAVTLCLPQDVQAEAFDWPEEFFAERVWLMDPPRHSFDTRGIWDAIGRAERPVIVAGGGVLYGRADGRLRDAVDITGLPVVETQAGKGALPFDHPCNLGAAGATGTSAANAALGEADLVIGLGTRYDDFTTASRTAFANPDVRFLNVNVNAHDARKLGGQAVVADVRDFLEMLLVEDTDQDVHVTRAWGERIASLRAEWDAELARVIQVHPERALPGQAEVIGVVNAAALAAEAAGRGATVLGAAGSLPGDLHKLWRTRDRKGYHLEYGYSCMGYEVAGGLGVALADPEREVFVMVGDGSWLMMSSEIVTAVQEGVRFTVILIDNHGYGSIGALSTSLGSEGFGTCYRYRTSGGEPGGSGGFDGEHLPIDLAANAASMGAHVVACRSIADLEAALDATTAVRDRPVVLTIETDPAIGVPGYDSWWDVPVAETSQMAPVQAARADYEQQRSRERWLV